LKHCPPASESDCLTFFNIRIFKSIIFTITFVLLNLLLFASKRPYHCLFC